MTTFAMAAGMLPTAIGLGEGPEFRIPMAIAVICGLISSTLLSLVLAVSSELSVEPDVVGEKPAHHRCVHGVGHAALLTEEKRPPSPVGPPCSV